MLLADKNAVIYGAGGPVGGAIARAFAREGASVFLAGRRLDVLRRLADEISVSGGQAEAAELDALEEQAVEEHADSVVQAAGHIDVSFNAIGHGDVHGMPLLDMPYEDFARPVETAVRSLFLTARAAARRMLGQGSGVIMAITATTARKSIPNIGGTGVAYDAIESLCRQWACELGPQGIRVVWVHTTGIPEAMSSTIEMFPDYGTWAPSARREELIALMEKETMLKRLTSLEDVGNAAAFAASDRAGAITASAMNLTGGSIPMR
jgi:NAD(P)-dependent dehydrogenase (short-subunit alcohol dehydrogenase family)